MARPRRMGAFNALDELLPGPEAPERPRLEAVGAPDPPEGSRRPPARGRRRDAAGGRELDRDAGEQPVDEQRRGQAFNALDELLPGPLAPRPRLLQVVSDPLRRRGRGRSKHLSAFNPLDDLEPEPPAPKARVSLRVPTDLLEAARDASAFLSESQGRVTLGDLAEDALRAELQRLAVEHNAGRPFPAREDRARADRKRR
jgi:hypothetical protein